MITFISPVPVLLGALVAGTIFTDAERSYFALKTEYRTDGRPDCFLIGSGETFVPKIADLNQLSVYPVIMERVAEYEH